MMRLFWISASLAMLSGFAVSSVALAAPPVTDPDWPCVQRLIPSLTAGTYWAGPLPSGDWRADSQISALVAMLAPRGVSPEQGTTKIDAFVGTTPAADRLQLLGEVFVGLVDVTNEERSRVIGRLKDLSRRQRDIGAIIDKATMELRDLPGDADAARREEVTNRRALLIRQFQETEKTMRYACEVPVQMEARLGSYARALQHGL